MVGIPNIGVGTGPPPNIWRGGPECGFIKNILAPTGDCARCVAPPNLADLPTHLAKIMFSVLTHDMLAPKRQNSNVITASNGEWVMHQHCAF